MARKKTEARMDIKSTLLLIGIAVVVITMTIATYASHHTGG